MYGQRKVVVDCWNDFTPIRWRVIGRFGRGTLQCRNSNQPTHCPESSEAERHNTNPGCRSIDNLACGMFTYCGEESSNG